ncbi:MAG TPA: SMP-30/gluconolactonase/LRE family protein [Microthrixaceae bacterium]|nr:SMP-30/gluconolactonase/LRE family protein [Microthrixaceae bacterium]
MSVPYRTVATELQFPEGPTPLADGSVLVVEIPRGTLSRVGPDGTVSVVAECGGGPNGSAIGPDGAVWITNNGGCFEWIDVGGILVPGGVPDEWHGGCIQRVDLTDGSVETVYTHCGDLRLRAPNDLVFDGHGGFWFTDHGVRQGRTSDRTGVYYALADGSSITEVLFPLDAPNGIGLSPDGDRLYVAETHTGRVWSWRVPEPGVAVGGGVLPPHGDLLAGLPGLQLLDSLAVDAEGHVCVGTLQHGGITVISPDGGTVEHVPIDDVLVTNIAFGGPDLRTAFVTASGTGRLLALDWPRPGLAPPHVA